jgi:hypothetical protein
MLQQCLSASRHALSWKSTTPYVSIPHLFLWVALHSVFFLTCRSTLLMLLGPLLHEIHRQHLKTVAIGFLEDICLNFFGLFGECVCIHCFDCSLVQHSQMKSWFHHLLLMWCDWEMCCHLHGITLKSKPKLFSVFCAHSWAFLELILQKTVIA